jgi:hypothetical protein
MSGFLLSITYLNGEVHSVSFPTARDRALCMIGLATAPVVLRIPDGTR